MKHNLFKYKGSSYEEPPIKYYYIYQEEIVGNVKYIYIRRKIPTFLHAMIFIILLAPLIYINYINYNINSNIIKNHIVRVPKEMYYDYNTGVLDLDIINDESNFEIISITITPRFENTNIVDIKGIEPGHSIGSIKLEYSFKELPVEARVIYRVYSSNISFKEIYRDVLIIDKNITNNDINRDF